jgi:hypothetical protein
MKDEQLILSFIKGRDGRIIARDSSGKICLLDIEYCRANKIFVKEYEDWRCVVVIDKGKCLIVQPITRTATAAENEKIRISKLKDKFAGQAKGSPGDRKTSNRH